MARGALFILLLTLSIFGIVLAEHGDGGSNNDTNIDNGNYNHTDCSSYWNNSTSVYNNFTDCGHHWNETDHKGNDTWSDGENPNVEGSGNYNSSSPAVAGATLLGSTKAYNKYNSIVIAHATMAALVWVLFMPLGALILRFNVRSSIVLKLHALSQIASYSIFVIAAILGVWLAQNGIGDPWSDVHPRLGLAILALAFLQPWLGFAHRRIFDKRVIDLKNGLTATKAPGRTVMSRMHVWLGRSLIIMAIINGGLGIRLAGSSPFQTSNTTRIVAIIYGIVAAAMFALYAYMVIDFEIRRRRGLAAAVIPHEHSELNKLPPSKLPSYNESESSLERERGPVRSV